MASPPDAQIVKNFIKQGYDKEIAERMVANRELILPYFLAGDLDIKIPKKEVMDWGRGYKRGFYLPDIKRKKSFKPVTMYRGLVLQSLDDLVLDAKKYGDESSENLVFGSLFKGEAETYAGYDPAKNKKELKSTDFINNNLRALDDYGYAESTRTGYVLKIQIPEVMCFKVDEQEVFLIPEHYKNLESYIQGVYEIKNPESVNAQIRYYTYDEIVRKLRKPKI